MVDVARTDVELKRQMLATLRSLPITNKTILHDSKILPIVQKWSAVTVGSGAGPSEGGEAENEPGATTPGGTPTPASLPHKKRHHLLQRLQADNADVSSSDSEMSDSAKSKPQAPAALDSDDTTQGDSTASNNTADETDTREGLEHVKGLASELVAEWDSLKEMFKIPKLKVEERKKREQELGQ